LNVESSNTNRGSDDSTTPRPDRSIPQRPAPLMTNSRLRTKGLILVCLVLAPLAFNYLFKGYHSLLNDPKDLKGRWVECRFALRGQDPFQIYLQKFHGPDAAFNKRESVRLSHVYENPKEPVYPPFAYAPAMIFVWMPWPADLYYYLFIDTACIAILVASAVVLSCAKTGAEKAVVALATLAIASICTTLGNGNFGLIVTVTLWAAVWFDQRNRPVLAGIFFWIAMIKPTVSLPFVMVFLLQRRWKAMAVAALLCIASCLFPWIADRTDPILMMREAMQTAKHFQFGGYGIINWLQILGVPDNRVTPVAALLVALPTATFFVLNRHLPIWKNLAVLCVAGRFWGYHMVHDNIMLFFLACAAWRIFLASWSADAGVLLMLVMGTLWLPSSLTEIGGVSHKIQVAHHGVGLAQHLIWLGAAVYVWRWEPQEYQDLNDSTDARVPSALHHDVT
jgi:hypothetical protein